MGGMLAGLSIGKGLHGLADSLGKKNPDEKMDSYHKGGKVKKTGKANLKKGELVLTKGQQRKIASKLKAK